MSPRPWLSEVNGAGRPDWVRGDGSGQAGSYAWATNKVVWSLRISGPALGDDGDNDVPRLLFPSLSTWTDVPLAVLLPCPSAQWSVLMTSPSSHNNPLWSTPVAPLNRLGNQSLGSLGKLTKIFYFVTGIQMLFSVYLTSLGQGKRSSGCPWAPFPEPREAPFRDLQRTAEVSLISSGSFSLRSIKEMSLCRGKSLVLGSFGVPLLSF